MKKVWRVEGVGPQRDGEQVFVEALYVEAYSETHARMRAEQTGMAVRTATPADPTSIPRDHAVLGLDPSPAQNELLLRIAASPLIRSPFLTIALAVFAGALASSCLWAAALRAFR